jgi:uncharacterized protein involved in exopolysaccharide biosynthesis
MSEQKINHEDQIYIPGIKNLIKQILSLFFWVFSFFALVANKSKLLLLCGLLLGLISGYIYYTTKPSLYKASMVVIHNELTKKTYAEIIDQLDKLTSTGSQQRLAEELKLPVDLAGNVLSIDATNINNEPLREDTSTKIKQPFKIIVKLKSNKASDSLQNAIINYVNNSPYIKRLKEQQNKTYIERISFIEKELSKLDSLKTEYTRFLATSRISATFYNNAFNPTDIYIHSNNLVNQKATILNSLNVDGTAISIVDGFKVPSSPQTPSLVIYLLLFGGMGLFAGFILGSLYEAEKKINRK